MKKFLFAAVAILGLGSVAMATDQHCATTSNVVAAPVVSSSSYSHTQTQSVVTVPTSVRVVQRVVQPYTVVTAPVIAAPVVATQNYVSTVTTPVVAAHSYSANVVAAPVLGVNTYGVGAFRAQNIVGGHYNAAIVSGQRAGLFNGGLFNRGGNVQRSRTVTRSRSFSKSR